MAGVGYLSALVLAVVLATAGIAKWRAPRRTTESFAGLGVPWPAAAARAVPLAEIGLAVGLAAWPRHAGAASLVVLAAFTAVLVHALRRGLAVGCACFGATATRHVSGAEVLRNLLLSVLAGASLFATRPVAPGVPGLVLVGTAVVLGAVVLAAWDLRRASALGSVGLAADGRPTPDPPVGDPR